MELSKKLGMTALLMMVSTAGYAVVIDAPATPIPEPSTWVLFALGLTGVILAKRKR